MNAHSAFDILAVVAILGWIVYRQTRWQVLDPARMWRLPIVCAVIGGLQLVPRSAGNALGLVGFALLALSTVLSLLVGMLMGALSQLRRSDGRVCARTGWTGSLLWLVLLVVRIGVEVWADRSGAAVVASTGVILLMLAVNRAARVAVLIRRAQPAGSFAAH